MATLPGGHCVSTDIATAAESADAISTKPSIHFPHYTKKVLLFSTKMGEWQIRV